MKSIKPTAVKAIWNGIAHFISFFTPESEVKVEEPVKFIVTKEATLKFINPKEMSSINETCHIKEMNKVYIPPQNAPFNANALNGIMGNKSGAITIPDK